MCIVEKNEKNWRNFFVVFFFFFFFPSCCLSQLAAGSAVVGLVLGLWGALRVLWGPWSSIPRRSSCPLSVGVYMRKVSLLPSPVHSNKNAKTSKKNLRIILMLVDSSFFAFVDVVVYLFLVSFWLAPSGFQAESILAHSFWVWFQAQCNSPASPRLRSCPVYLFLLLFFGRCVCQHSVVCVRLIYMVVGVVCIPFLFDLLFPIATSFLTTS